MKDFPFSLVDPNEEDVLKNISVQKGHKGDLTPEQAKWGRNVMFLLGLTPMVGQHRMLAGAISSANIAILNGSMPDKEEAKKLLQQIMSYGPPKSWKDASIPMRITSAKLHLDMLSLSEEERQPKALGKGEVGGQSKAFWIGRKDPDGITRSSFICKPTTAVKGLVGDAPSGGPRGGEVVREALAGTAAGFMQTIGIDIGMPETHVVELPGQLVGRQTDESVMCSVQEVRSKKGDFADFSLKDAPKLSKEQIAGLAMFDCMTLNSDRHGGNILLDPQGNLVPIDHGESLVEPDNGGLGRLRLAMGGPHNILLSLPGAHEKLSEDMVRKLGSMDSSNYGKALKSQRNMLAKVNVGTAGLVSDNALIISERAAKFVNLASRYKKPQLSPATIQLALASSPKDMLDPTVGESAFVKKAKATIEFYAQHGDTIREVMLAPDTEWNTLKEIAEKRGWRVAARRGQAPDVCNVSDPIMLLTICLKGLDAPPRNGGSPSEAIAKLHKSKEELVTGDEAMKAIVMVRIETIRQILECCPQTAQKHIGALEKLQQMYSQQKIIGSLVEFAGKILKIVSEDAMEVQNQRFATAMKTFRIDEMIAGDMLDLKRKHYPEAQNALEHDDPVTAAKFIASIEEQAKGNVYLQNAILTVTGKLKQFQKTYLVPNNNGAILEAKAALAMNDPFEASKYLKLLREKVTKTYFEKAYQHIRSEFDGLLKTFVIDEKDASVVQIEAALEEKNLDEAATFLFMLTTKCFTNRFAPVEATMLAFCKKAGISEEDEDLCAAIKSARAGKAVEAGLSWKALLNRVKSGEFGHKPRDQAKEALLETRKIWQIADDQECVEWFKISCEQGDDFQALMWLGKLDRLVELGVFDRK